MIKTFEQFVSDMYNTSVNEAYQSSKLRNIIKQHGKPKWEHEYKMLYDIKDDEIVDVVSSRNEYYKKYKDYRTDFDDKSEATFMLELEDGYCIVISNLGILKDFWSGFDSHEKMRNEFKKRHSERHKGNLGKHNFDDIHHIHMRKRNEIEERRFAEKLQPYTDEIVKKINSLMDDIYIGELDLDENGRRDEFTIESNINIDGIEYDVFVEYSARIYNTWESYGEAFYSVEYELEKFSIYDNENDIEATNDKIGITYQTHKDLFKEVDVEEISGGIVDPYEAYGVSNADFI